MLLIIINGERDKRFLNFPVAIGVIINDDDDDNTAVIYFIDEISRYTNTMHNNS